MRKIVEVQYFIDEKRSRTEDDYPVKGDFSVISMGSLTHGPFYTLDDVTAKLKELEEFYGQEKIIKSRRFVQVTTRVGEVEKGEKLRLSVSSSSFDKDELDRVEDIVFIVREEGLSE